MLGEKTAPLLFDPPPSSEHRFRAGSVTMLRQSRRLLWRSRGLVYSALASVTVCWLLLSASSGTYSVVPWTVDMSGTAMGYGIMSGPKGKGQAKSKDYDDKVNQWLFSKEYNETGMQPGAGAIYGNTLSTLTDKDKVKPETDAKLTSTGDTKSFTEETPYYFDPYPLYSRDEWRKEHRADFVPCDGPTGELKDVQVFRGHPEGWSEPAFGSFDLFDIDPNLCYERDARLGQYGLKPQTDKSGRMMDWTKVQWGKLQQECAEKNMARFDKTVQTVEASEAADDAADELRKQRQEQRLKRRGFTKTPVTNDNNSSLPNFRPEIPPESRTAILLRSYTGRRYTDNEKQMIRSLISELSLRTGGEYRVFLLVQVKDSLEDLALWDAETYKYVLQTQVPKEFHDIAILWGSYEVQGIYPLLDPLDAATVHNAQWLSVQKFTQEHPEFDYIWNWEMDSRLIGHHYDVLTKIGEFAKKQPRKGLWERNERFYIPSYHGDYDTKYRKWVEKASGKETVWGAPDLSFINPVGPKPPVASPNQDNYEWGVGEEADLITLSPMFDPLESNWILRDQVWQYNDTTHNSTDLPRRATIVTQSRLSRRLIETMSAENLRGNHVGSEMAANTVALLHGLKAVYAPMPVFMDRPWQPEQLQKWFNPGPGGTAGGPGCAMGWGREHRFQGSTWYFRAGPPQRLYNNWMGYEDTGIGGRAWEKNHGRPCLPAMFLHPIKDVQPTWYGYASQSDLPYNWWEVFKDEDDEKDKQKS
ncbi:hypothetical protein VPNG_06955 [Cytospora leucostoma]|uniref:Uncharacterized protein n=1 Tax=Cytospora leucostoma TaxID=1230097 RepID=A0A423WXJ8_9PEZI|nr:hypothetical protein VPNG_06955 [Cytospora leucostoma]